VIKFHKSRVFEHTTIWEFYSLLRSVMMGARGVNLWRKLCNNQALPGIMNHMAPVDWKQWIKERPSLVQ
jgi:hypothetical protein